jgi:glycosyltransferase involved in cell wall biosynthesis
MLPLVFEYYDRFVDKFIIYDNYSTDGSESIIESYSNAEIRKFHSNGFNDVVQNEIKNNCWKKSRGKADFVIVCDVDEVLYHPRIMEVLSNMQKEKVSIPAIDGFNMYSDGFPTEGKIITEQIKTGVPDAAYSKNIIFDPHRIVEIGNTPGGHTSSPLGIVEKGEIHLKLLHYKNLGGDYLLKRHRLLAERLSETNIKEGLGVHLLYPEEKVLQSFKENLNRSQPVI